MHHQTSNIDSVLMENVEKISRPLMQICFCLLVKVIAHSFQLVKSLQSNLHLRSTLQKLTLWDLIISQISQGELLEVKHSVRRPPCSKQPMNHVALSNTGLKPINLSIFPMLQPEITHKIICDWIYYRVYLLCIITKK